MARSLIAVLAAAALAGGAFASPGVARPLVSGALGESARAMSPVQATGGELQEPSERKRSRARTRTYVQRAPDVYTWGPRYYFHRYYRPYDSYYFTERLTPDITYAPRYYGPRNAPWFYY